MDIPLSMLTKETLQAVIEAFVLREGTDYGEREISLTDKVAAVEGQLRRGEARVVYDDDSETCSIVPRA